MPPARQTLLLFIDKCQTPPARPAARGCPPKAFVIMFLGAALAPLWSRFAPAARKLPPGPWEGPSAANTQITREQHAFPAEKYQCYRLDTRPGGVYSFLGSARALAPRGPRRRSSFSAFGPRNQNPLVSAAACAGVAFFGPAGGPAGYGRASAPLTPNSE
jgi:hypothetical protein